MKKETVFIDEDTLTKEELEALGDNRNERLEAYAMSELLSKEDKKSEQTAE